MPQRLTRRELVLVAGAVVAACLLRCVRLDQVAIEHFDEGVYSSGVWYGQLSSQPYPGRHLYAPPALPRAIEIAAALIGPDLGPFLPGLAAGVLSVIFIWGLTRTLFGQAAGLVVVCLAALNDFHILYSRMALTDVPVMMWMLLSVWLAVIGIDRQRFRFMAAAGLACAAAWWTKYSGWLPLAIIGSGSVLWWLLSGRRVIRGGRLVTLNAVMMVVAAAAWSPWYAALWQRGGYSEVAANHAAYLHGWEAWHRNLATQLTWYMSVESWLGGLAVWGGIVMAAGQRWNAARRSTWNRATEGRGPVSGRLSGRFLTAAFLLALASLTIGSFATLASVGLGGMAAIFLWPSLSVLRTQSAAAVSTGRKGSKRMIPYGDSDYQASASVDPLLGACVVAAWFCGMLLTVPRYTPFPRLLLPLVVSVWIMAAAGIGWWIEAVLNVARRAVVNRTSGNPGALQRVTGPAVAVCLLLGFWMLQSGRVQAPVIHQPRTGLRTASQQVARMCLEDAGLRAARDQTPGQAGLVVYGFGEPAVLYHLSAAGLVAAPVQDLDFQKAAQNGRPLPTYFVFGPNALRTPGFMYDWVEKSDRFEHLGNVSWMPGDIVLFNLFSPRWLAEHPGDEREQILEVYRLR